MVTEPEQNPTQHQDEGQTLAMDEACGVEHQLCPLLEPCNGRLYTNDTWGWNRAATLYTPV